MPKSVGEEDIKPKRTATKRVSSTAEKKPVVKRPRKVAAKKTTPKKVAPSVDESLDEELLAESPRESTKTRKAPTPFSAQKSAQKRFNINVAVVVIILLFGVGSSAVVGFSDDGQIDVNQVIEARNERVRNNQTDGRDIVANSVTVPVQNTNNSNQVDGGLVGLGDRNVPAPEEATSTATSTLDSAVASSSDAVATSTPAEVTETQPATEPEAEGVTQ